MVDLLVQTSLDQLFLILQTLLTLYKTSYFNEEVNCTEPSPSAGSAITNRREPRHCLGRLFNSKLGCIATPSSKCMVCMQPLLKLKTRPKAHPVN
jgi:hypothetical protein